MPPERIVPLPSSENFWSVGGPGPCGPDSEMYWDWGEEVGCAEGCLPGLHALRALPRVRKPRLHVVRAPCRRHAHRAAEQEHRHRLGARARRARRAGRGIRLRHRRLPADHGLGRRAVRRRVRLVRGRDEGSPRTRRPRPRHDVHRRRGCRAVERGARLRAAPRGPARRPARAAHRHAVAVPPRSRRRRDRADGPGVSGARRAPRRDPPRARRRGGALRRDARARDGEVRGGRRQGRDHGRGRLRAADDVRLPDRADGGARARARPRLQRRGVHAADGGAPRDVPRAARAATSLDSPLPRGRSSSGTSRPTSAPRSPRTSTSARATSRSSSPSRRSIRRAAARSPTPAGSRRTTARAPTSSRRCGSSRRPGARLSGHGVRGGRPRPRRRAVGGPLPDDGEPHGDASPPQGAAGGARRPRPPGRLGRASRQAPLRLHASDRADAGGAGRDRAARQRARLCERAGADLRDAAVRSAKPRRDDAVRGEVRRRRARRRRRRLVARALRRHARALDGRDRTVRDCLGELRRRRLAPDRGGDRGRGVRAAARAGTRGRCAARRARTGAEGVEAAASGAEQADDRLARTRRATSCSSR